MRSRSIAWRLALAFAVVCALVLSAIGVFLYRSLGSEIAYRDDLALLGRLEQVRALLADSDSLGALQARPRLYQNMLGNLDSLLLVRRADGSNVIAINPRQRDLPPLNAIAREQTPQRRDVLTWQAPDGAELALLSGDAQGPNGELLTVIAGKVLTEREQMLASYRLRLYLAVGLGALLAFALGLVLLRRGLQPLRQLSAAVRGIDLRSLDQRLPASGTPAELLEPVQALNGMLARLDDSVQRLSQFSADLAHEIRTPLHTLLASNGQALNHPRSTAEYQELLASNMEEFERLKRMAENLMFLARAEQAERALDLRTLELHEVGNELCDYFEALADDRNIRLENALHGELVADQQLLQRALGNLLANAVRHADEGTLISLRRRDEPGVCWLQVHNHGPVIAPEHLGKLFDRFYRVDLSRAQPGDSGGLGLAIVQSIMLLHGGRVRVSSDAEGTVFGLGFVVN
ncbi:two-component system, OmpR family, heavy metal sensor histidine kinase CusS [Pseudomonas sp. LAMO17WK12:I6]|uniref:heavy metal sensor histidine kinase n=1 Tax=unclassified Pseudomonas TaxID=196821 RepID=UPI000BCD31AB|nr:MULTISPECIES: heavy metal sensor histidine kinase [unclassified Pseudomonas]SNY15731.1 two-component system, OmpR family, heavy metal sensor histidine kinase CusS [Pseudomonas sp. LAMO17WK12:I6]SNY19281.1 two-component system, OmpR family, heavy metal sensor histidine kinase CusS [Pseudomonas sp. LAMO17WK12:I5]